MREIYPGCKKYFNLSFLIKLLHLKVISGWSNKSFNMLLQLLKDALPNGKTLPKPHYEVREGNARLGLRLCVNACK